MNSPDMVMATDTTAAGGFLVPDLPSPPPSSVTSSSFASATTLPRPRKHPLKQASAKETAFIQYVDRGIMDITRKYAKKFSSGEEEEEEEVKGYESFKEVARDIERLTDVVWVSGTPSLQTPYLLSLALLVTNYLPSFPPSPRMTFRLLHKLDMAFSSLLQGHDLDSGDVLPGFETGRGLSTTQKVRIKSLVERTRVIVVDAMRGADSIEVYESDDEEGQDNDDDDDEDDMDDVEEVGQLEMEIAKVYDRTLVELGDTLGVDDG